MNIITSQTGNPTPNRDWDYSATLDGYEGGEPIGYGATPELATAELLEQIENAT
jgi:hypothetical protein